MGSVNMAILSVFCFLFVLVNIFFVTPKYPFEFQTTVVILYDSFYNIIIITRVVIHLLLFPAADFFFRLIAGRGRGRERQGEAERERVPALRRRTRRRLERTKAQTAGEIAGDNSEEIHTQSQITRVCIEQRRKYKKVR